jgi:glutathione peroxidase
MPCPWPATLRLLFVLVPLLFTLPAGAAECPSLLDHRYTTLQGHTVNLCEFADRPILVVNTASKCGYTPQFEKLEGMYRKYKDRGLVVIGFPSNDFRQELATNKEIGDFCRLTYQVQFPMIEKRAVTGEAVTPSTSNYAR